MLLRRVFIRLFLADCCLSRAAELIPEPTGRWSACSPGARSRLSSIRIANVSVFLNGTGMSEGTNGQIASFGNNFNSGSGTPNASLTQQ